MLNQRALPWLIIPVILMITLMPSTVLTAVGWGTRLFGEHPLTKVHPASYLAAVLAAFLVLFKWHEEHLAGGRVPFAPWPVVAYMVTILGIFVFLTLFHGGGSVSFMLDTLLVPGFVLILLLHLTEAQRARLFQILIAVFVVNVLLAMGEATTGQRLVPFTVQGVPVLYDRRPTALMGHPLHNAHLTAAMLFFALGSLQSRAGQLGVAGVMLLGLIVFGGRSALAIALLAGLAYGVWGLMHRVMARRLRWSDLALLSGGALLLPIGIVGVFVLTPFGQLMLERLTWDDSAETRLTLFRIFRFLDPLDLLIGIPVERLTTYLLLLNMPWTIENAWVQLLVRFGVVLFLAFLWSLWLLFRYLATGQSVGGVFALGVFLLVASTNNSLAGKSNLLSVLVALALTARAYRAMHSAGLPPFAAVLEYAPIVTVSASSVPVAPHASPRR